MAKSILKDNYTQPIERSSQYSQSQSQSQNLTGANRRVSFAREVTLHKIDYIQNPNNKRRRTIAGEEITSREEGRVALGDIHPDSFVDPDGPGSEDDGGTRIISDSSDDEDGEDQRPIEIVGELNDDDDDDNDDDEGVVTDGNVPGNEDSEDDKTMDLTDTIRQARETMRKMEEEDQDDEQTMELTGTISRTPPVTDYHTSSNFDHINQTTSHESSRPIDDHVQTVVDNGVIDEAGSDSDDSIKFLSQSKLSEPANWSVEFVKTEPITDSSGPPNTQDDSNEDDTQPMELTQTLPKTVSNTIEKPVLREIPEITEDDHNHEDSELNEMANELENDMRNIDTPTESTHNNANETEEYQEGDDSRAIDVVETGANESLRYNEISEHMDLTLVDIKKINLQEQSLIRDEDDLSMAMDFTIIHPKRGFLTGNEPVAPANDTDEQELTSNVEPAKDDINSKDNETNKIHVGDHTITSDEDEDEDEDEDDDDNSMELTQAIPRNVSATQNEEGEEEDDMQLTTAFTKKVDDSTNNALPTENSQPMDLTQTEPTTIQEEVNDTNLEVQEENEHEEPMELTQALPKTVEEFHDQDALDATQAAPNNNATDVDVESNHETKHIVNEEEEHEVPMDLTQPLPMKVIVSSTNPLSIKQVSQTDEEESTMELTQSQSQSQSQPQSNPAEESSVVDFRSSQDQEIKSDSVIEPSQVMDISMNSINEDTSHIEHVVTTTIPLAEITQDEDDQSLDNKEVVNGYDEEEEEEDDDDYADYVPVTLIDFFNNIGVQFYDDLELDITNITRSSITGSTEDPPTMEDYIKSRPQLGLLELYEFCCQELNKNIINGREIYGDFEKNIENDNPLIFKRYYKLDEKDKLLTNIKLQLIRDYARLQSKKTWYSWRSQLIESLISQLNVDLENLESDKSRLISAIDSVNKVYDMSREKLIHLQKKFNDLISSSNSQENLPMEELKFLKQEVAKAKQTILDFNADLVNKEEELIEIKDSWNTSMDSRTEFSSSLQDLQVAQEVNDKEIREVFERYKSIEELSELSLQESKITFLFDKSLSVEFDFGRNNINYTIESNNFKNEILMQSAINFPINPEVKISEQFMKFSKYWKCLKKFDIAVYYTTLKYPTEVFTKGDSIELKISYYNFTNAYELQIFGKLKIIDLLEYQNSIEFEAKPKRDNIKKDFRNQIIQDLNIFPTLHSLQIVQ